MADDPKNPYAPPSAAGEWVPTAPAEAPPVVSSAPKVFGVLSIVFASIVLLFGLLASCGGFAGGSMSQLGKLGSSQVPHAEEMKQALAQMGTIYSAIGIQGLILTVMSALLLAIGIGQLRYRAWAGAWSVYWGGLALVALAGMVAMYFLMIGPAYQRFFDLIARATPSGTMPTQLSGSLANIFGGTSSVMTVLFYAPYPILLLFFFTREHVRASMNR